jgi:hypothetical protein
MRAGTRRRMSCRNIMAPTISHFVRCGKEGRRADLLHNADIAEHAADISWSVTRDYPGRGPHFPFRPSFPFRYARPQSLP